MILGQKSMWNPDFYPSQLPAGGTDICGFRFQTNPSKTLCWHWGSPFFSSPGEKLRASLHCDPEARPSSKSNANSPPDLCHPHCPVRQINLTVDNKIYIPPSLQAFPKQGCLHHNTAHILADTFLCVNVEEREG